MKDEDYLIKTLDATISKINRSNKSIFDRFNHYFKVILYYCSVFIITLIIMEIIVYDIYLYKLNHHINYKIILLGFWIIIGILCLYKGIFEKYKNIWIPDVKVCYYIFLYVGGYILSLWGLLFLIS